MDQLTWRKMIMLRSTTERGIQEALDVISPYVKRKLSEQERVQLRNLIVSWRSVFQRKWKASRLGLAAFLEREKEWLSGHMNIPCNLVRQKHIPTGQSAGAKRRRAAHVASEQGEHPDILLLGTAKTIGKIGTPQSKARSVILRQLAKKKSKAVEILNLTTKKPQIQRNLTDEEGLKLLLELSLTKEQYQTLRNVTNAAGHKKLFPVYKRIVKAKALARPSDASVTATIEGAEVKLAALLEHTCDRIVELQREVITQEFEQSGAQEKEARMIVTWGMDGAGNQSKYNQKGEAEGFIDESHLFITSMVPLLLSTTECIYWKNPKPQSPLFCRPIKMQFKKEDKDFVLNEQKYFEDQIKQLTPITVQVSDDYTLKVTVDMHLTLIDGKVLCFFTNTASQQSCPICHSNPTDFTLENIGTEKFVPKELSLNFGISPLHAWLRVFELCLHISYRLSLPVKVWRVSKNLLPMVKIRKRLIQQRMWKAFGLRVDFPNLGGGNSNNGNTARRAFGNIDLLAETLELDKQLLLNFKRILLSLICQLPINPAKFGELCQETAELYHKMYKWYYMPATLHKILVHGRQIMEASPLPLGVLGEDAPESRHKLFRYIRLHHTRKRDRKLGNLDAFKRSLETSDPVLSSSRLTTKRRTKKKSLKIIQDLLLEPDSASVRVGNSGLPLLPEVELEGEDNLFEYFDEDIPVAEEIEI